MNIIKARNLSEALPELLKFVLKHGKAADGKLQTEESVALWVQYPQERHLWTPDGKVNPFYAIVSTLFEHCPDRNTDWLTAYQFDEKQDSLIRYNPEITGDYIEDELCFVAQLEPTEVIHGVLSRIGLELSVIAEVAAFSTGHNLGPMTLNIKRPWIEIEPNIKLLQQINDPNFVWVNPYKETKSTPRPIISTDRQAWRQQVQLLLEIGVECMGINDPWLRRSLQPALSSFLAFQEGDYLIARKKALEIAEPSMRLVCEHWLVNTIQRINSQ